LIVGFQSRGYNCLVCLWVYFSEEAFAFAMWSVKKNMTTGNSSEYVKSCKTQVRIKYEAPVGSYLATLLVKQTLKGGRGGLLTKLKSWKCECTYI
jgi:hypothetical protein